SHMCNAGEIFRYHFHHALSIGRFTLGELLESFVGNRFDQPVAESAERGSASDAITSLLKAGTAGVAGREVRGERRLRSFLLLTRRQSATRSSNLTTQWLGFDTLLKNWSTALSLRPAAQEIVDREDMHGTGLRVVTNSYFVDEEPAAANGWLGMASG